MSTNPSPTRPNALGPSSRLLVAFFERLNSANVTYAVMNNYEELPRVIPSDIDITVPPAFFRCLDRFILDFAQSVDALLVQKLWHGNQKCAYILGTGAEGSREFLQLDFFVAFSTKGAPALLSHEALIAGACAFNDFRVPAPEVELLFIAMRRLFKDDWSERHCARIAELRARITKEGWLPQHYHWLLGTIERAVDGDVDGVVARRAVDWNRLRMTARKQIGLSGLLSNALRQAWRIQCRLRDETGITAVVDGLTDPLDADASTLLDGVFHRNLRLNESRLAKLGPLSRFTLAAKLALLKRRKGLVFLHVGPGHDRMRHLVRLLGRFGQIDLYLPEQSVKPAQVVEAIARRQTENTARAIARGLTQTSG